MPFPRVDTSTDRRTHNTLRRVHAWLILNAVTEANSRGDDFNRTQFNHMDIDNLSHADIDSLNFYLFGDADTVICDQCEWRGDNFERLTGTPVKDGQPAPICPHCQTDAHLPGEPLPAFVPGVTEV